MDSRREILEKAFELGQKYEREYTGCAQTVIAAIFDTLGIWNEDVFRAASGLADGLGLTGDGSCGALVGASMVISYMSPREKENFSDQMRPMKAYFLVKKLHDRFVEIYGSCRCHDLQRKLMGRTFNLWDKRELKEASKSGMLDHCSKVVGTTAKLAVEMILSERLFNLDQCRD
ncbi:MAG: C-GCAxxG-C-C family protein [Archaeoglobales archaeon]|nr:C-GCAxxG-C-C family protein [Archaeoglobales archaeon]